MRVSGHFTALFSILGFSQSAKVQATTPGQARTIAPAEVAPPEQTPAAAPTESSSAPSLRMPVGAVPLSLGLPADRATRQMLYDELDFQRACQVYLWALPIVSFAEWQHAARAVFGAGDTDMVIYESIKDKLGILTANATTPYILGLPDLSNTGPLVVEYPAGATAEASAIPGSGRSPTWGRPAPIRARAASISSSVRDKRRSAPPDTV